MKMVGVCFAIFLAIYSVKNLIDSQPDLYMCERRRVSCHGWVAGRVHIQLPTAIAVMARVARQREEKTRNGAQPSSGKLVD